MPSPRAEPPALGASRTLVFFHAHPDDEALFTSGTMARAAAEGHRVVLVVATAGEAGLAASEFHAGGDLGQVRRAELDASAAALGVARTVVLGFADSGLHGEAEQSPGGPVPFVRADLDEAAGRLAEVLREESAHVLTTYDPAGGYGHPDHVKVHEVGARAAELAGTPVVLEATVPRDTIARAVRWAAKVYRFPPEFDPTSFERSFVPRAEISHRVDVRRYADARRASMAAHSSQASDDGGPRTLAAMLKVPGPLFARLFGREWYVQRPRGRTAPPAMFEPTR
jgi:LmbE family N-acetylglucosaminyl deacetylase